MKSPKLLQQTIGSILIIVSLAGCATHIPTPPPTLPPLSPTFAPPSTPAQPTGLFKLIQTVKVTPAGNFVEGAFVKIGYVPGRGKIIVTFNTKLTRPQGGCTDGYTYAYREYTEAMAFAGCFSLESTQNRRLSQTPCSPRQRVGRRSLSGPTPTANAAPLPLPFGLRQRFPRCRCRFAPLQLGATLGLSAAPRALTSLTRWQSASSTPTRAAAGFSWTSPAASEQKDAPSAP